MARVSKQNTISTTDIDQIVAEYAPIGVQMKRAKRIQRSCIAAGVIALIGGSVLLSTSTITPFSAVDEATSIVNKPGQNDTDPLSKERAEFASKMADLEHQIADIKAQKLELEVQQATLTKHGELLTQLLADTGTEQSNLEKRQEQGSQLDQEIAAMASQRQALQERWQQFEAQGELLAMEIIAVNAQRKELESQRRQIDQQRQELAKLLKDADGLYRQNTRSIERVPTQEPNGTSNSQETIAYDSDFQTMNVDELDQMRGGFSVGDGLDVSFGFTQTGSVNGVEQYTNNFTIDSMANGIDKVDMSNMNSVVLQNGNGNFVSGSVLDSLAHSFGNIIQNSLDDQVISTTTTYDIALHNMPGTVQGMAGEQALMDSLGSFR
jgi:predicted RNase H-like nuclease (RuvC/YqgF family)